MELREINRFYYRVFIFFLAGFLIALAVVFVGQERLIEGSGFLDDTALYQFRMLDPDRTKLFLYSLKTRLLPAGYLIILTIARLGGVSVFAYLIWCGFCAGTILSVLSLRFGVRGIVLFSAGIMPQMIILIPAYFMLFRWCVMSVGMTGEKIRMYDLIRSILLILAGCLLEGYLNPWMMEKVFAIL